MYADSHRIVYNDVHFTFHVMYTFVNEPTRDSEMYRSVDLEST